LALVCLFPAPARSQEFETDLIKRLGPLTLKPPKQGPYLRCIRSVDGEPDSFAILTAFSPADKKKLLDGMCPHAVKDLDFYQDYAARKSFWPAKCRRTYNELFGDETYFDSIETLDRFIVKSAFDSLGRAEVAVSQERKELCRPDVYQGLTSRYLASVKKDGIHIGLGLDVQAKTFRDLGVGSGADSGRAYEMFQGVQACQGELISFWRRYGIVLDLDLYFEHNAKPADESWGVRSPTVKMDMMDAYGRADTSTFYHGGQEANLRACIAQCQKRPAAEQADCSFKTCIIPRRGKTLCRTLLHETGHHLGFPDEYSDPACPSRPFLAKESEKAPSSVMNDHFAADVAFMPRQLLQLLEPLCR
jgi:hypothetical protein